MCVQGVTRVWRYLHVQMLFSLSLSLLAHSIAVPLVYEESSSMIDRPAPNTPLYVQQNIIHPRCHAIKYHHSIKSVAVLSRKNVQWSLPTLSLAVSVRRAPDLGPSLFA